MKHIVVAAILAALLGGCASNSAKEAAIEDHGIKATAAPQTDQPAAQTTPLEAKQAHADVAKTESTKETTVATPKPADKPETRAVAQASIETKPIDATKADAAFAKPVLDPKDPKSPLAQRKIYFDYDSYTIRDEFRSLLEQHAQYLKDNKQVKIVLQGNSDERGSPEYNIALGQRRAEAVMQVLSLLGVTDHQMEAVSFGAEKPAVDAHDEAAWSQNRRTEIAYPNE